jgi:hypothetical protein
MANVRLALVACKTATEGPWTLAKGNEEGISINLLNTGETIRLMIEMKNSPTISHSYHESGSFIVDFTGCRRYRVLKQIADFVTPSATTVEIKLNGPA